MNSIVMSVMTSLPMAGSGFSFSGFFNNARLSLQTIGQAFIMLLGLVMIVVAGWQIAKGLISPQKAQTNWFMVIALLIVGGIFVATTGLNFLQSVGENAGQAIQGLGNGQQISQILPWMFR